MKLLRIITPFFFLPLTVVLKSQVGEEISLQKITEFAQNYNSKFCKQKVYLQLDKDIYFQNEKLRISAFVNSGPTSRPDTLSKNLYVELWTPSRIRYSIIRLKLLNGRANGSISLSDTLEDGIYQIRAFTDRMINYPSEFYFNHNFEFHNSNYPYLISPKQANKNLKTLKKLQKQKSCFAISLYPEGGNLIAGQPAKVYFKAANSFGNRAPVKIDLLKAGDKTKLLTASSSNGLGEFSFVPTDGEKYKVIATFGNGKMQTIELPEPTKDGILGTVEVTTESINLKLSKPNIKSNDPSANRYFILIHSSDYIQKVCVADLQHDTIINFNKSDFEEGIVNFSVFSNRLENVSNFKTFILPENTINSNAISIAEANDSLYFTFTDDFISTIQSGSLSVYESDSLIKDLPEFENENFLASEIKGWIPSESEFNFTRKAEYYHLLVNTMPTLTPDWATVFGNPVSKSLFLPEKGIEVAGKITTDIFAIPIKNASVRLEVMSNYNDVYETVTDDNGQFYFGGFDFYDTLQLKIIARKQSGRKAVQIVLRNDPIPEISEYNGNFFLTTQSLRDDKAYRLEQGKKASAEAHKKEMETQEFYNKVMHGRPDNILYGKDLPQHLSVLEAIQGRVAGVNVSGNDVIIRGRNTLFGGTDPLVLVDDVPVDVSYLSTMTMYDVDRIEILKGPSTAIYGVRGANGVIAIYTKTGEFMKRGEIDFTLVGYQKPEKFYSKNLSKTNENSKLPETILWVPEIKSQSTKTDLIKIKKPNQGKFILIVLMGTSKSGKTIHQELNYKIN